MSSWPCIIDQHLHTNQSEEWQLQKSITSHASDSLCQLPTLHCKINRRTQLRLLELCACIRALASICLIVPSSWAQLVQVAPGGLNFSASQNYIDTSLFFREYL